MLETFAFVRIAMANNLVDPVAIDGALAAVQAGDYPEIGEAFLAARAMTPEAVELVERIRHHELGSPNGTSRIESAMRPPTAGPRGVAQRAATVMLSDEEVAERQERVSSRKGLARQKYVLMQPIGEGGQGVVRCARDTDMDRLVAVKMLRPEHADPEGQERFLREIHTTGKLEHPNIVPVYDMGQTEDGLPYYVMRYVRGQTLAQILDRLEGGADHELGRQFPRARLLQILYQVALGVHFAHDQDCLHCDLKPANIIIGDYGEAIVLDWGLVLDRSGETRMEGRLETDEIEITPATSIMGTPEYMAPEQALGHLELIDPRTDVYALGTILYEILTFTHAFRGRTVKQVLADVIHGQVERPRVLAPERAIPAELERICTTAMSVKRSDRQQSARQFAEEIVEFLEGARERERLAQAALAQAALGTRHREQHENLRAEVGALEQQVATLEEALPGSASMSRRKQLWKLEEVLETTREQELLALGQATDSFTAALALDRGCRPARRGLAEIYWRQFLDAETSGDRAMAALMRSLVQRYDDGRFDDGLRGDGHLTVTCDVGGVEVHLHKYRESGRRLQPGPDSFLGSTPLHRVSVGMGRYQLVVRYPGAVDLIVPFRIVRSGAWEADLRIYTPEQVGEGFVLVPRGPFQFQGDDSFRGAADAEIIDLPDFCIGRFPVTCAEYRTFLDDLAGSDPDVAIARAPRESKDGASLWHRSGSGRFEPIEADETWGDRYPIRHVSWHDAMAYAAWRSERDGREYTLPTEQEWEKAARGCDARIFPWGDRFDASFCNVTDAHEGASAPCSVDDYPLDESPYGVRGLGGNVQDWCLTEVSDRPGLRLLRGGTFQHPGATAQSARRRARAADELSYDTGFRLRALPRPRG